MKITFNAKIVADVSDDPRFKTGMYPGQLDEPTIEWVGILLKDNKCDIELVPCWDNSAEPTLIITEKK